MLFLVVKWHDTVKSHEGFENGGTRFRESSCKHSKVISTLHFGETPSPVAWRPWRLSPTPSKPSRSSRLYFQHYGKNAHRTYVLICGRPIGRLLLFIPAERLAFGRPIGLPRGPQSCWENVAWTANRSSISCFSEIRLIRLDSIRLIRLIFVRKAEKPD